MRTTIARRSLPHVLGAALALALSAAACATSPAASRVEGAGSAGGTSASAAATAGATGTTDLSTAAFVGSRRSRKYYPAACHTVRLVAAADRVGFASMKDAEAAGFAKDLYSTDCRY